MTSPRAIQVLFAIDRSVGIGVFDGFSALIAARLRADFLWLSSFCASASLGRPDIGLTDRSELRNMVHVLATSTRLPIVVDLDSGHGGGARLRQIVRDVWWAGASAVSIEDAPDEKYSSLYNAHAPRVVSLREHTDRIVTAVHAVPSTTGCRVIARTEALVVGLGVEETLRRAHAYVDAGAEAIFVQSVQPNAALVLEVCRRWEWRTPIYLTPTTYMNVPRKSLFEAGATHIIYANQVLRAAHFAMQDIISSLLNHDETSTIDASISSVHSVAHEVGAGEMIRPLRHMRTDTQLPGGSDC